MADSRPGDPAVSIRRRRARLIAVAIAVLVAGLAGYMGFVSFVGSERDAAAGTMVLAAAVGFAAFFSPCSFPLLLTFLSRQAHQSRRDLAKSALLVGLGAALLLVALGGVVILGGEALGRTLVFRSPAGRVFRGVVGAFLILLGLRQVGIGPVQMRWLDGVAGWAGRVLDGGVGRARGDLAYGFGYLLAGFG